MSQQVTDAELANLEYGQIDLQARIRANRQLAKVFLIKHRMMSSKCTAGPIG